MIKLPKVKNEFGRKRMSYYAAFIYNELPLNVKKFETQSLFKNALDKYFFE